MPGVYASIRALTVFVLGIGAQGCGGPDDDGEQPYGVIRNGLQQRLTSLQVNPSCFVEAPHVTPQDLSQTYIEEVDAANAKREYGATQCVERYRGLFNRIVADPLAERWSVYEELNNQIIEAVPSDFQVGRDLGYIAFQVHRRGIADAEPIDFDPCMRRATEMDVEVYFDENLGDMQHRRLSITWGDDVTLVTKPGPTGLPLPLLYRGCDPLLDASFGRAERYLESEPVSCWKNDRFIDCGAVEVWPEPL